MVLADWCLGLVLSHKPAIVVLPVLPRVISNKVVEVAAVVAALGAVSSRLVLSSKGSRGPLLRAVALEGP